MPLNPLMLKLMPGAIAICAVGGTGYYLGLQKKQVEVDLLQEKLTEYKVLGQRVDELRLSINKEIKDQNVKLVDDYNQEIEKIRADYMKFNKALSEATDSLKKGGQSVKNSITALTEDISKFPVGNPEREAKVTELIALVVDPVKRQQLCVITPVPKGLLASK
jgi:chromosome segregation ATPase